MSEEIIDTGYQYASIEKRHELDNTAQELVKAVGKQFVRALIMTPCSYVQPGTEELRGITILLSSDTPVSKELIRSTLGSGTAVYELDTMADNSKIEPEKLWKRKLLFNACTPDRAATDTLEFQLLPVTTQSTVDWVPCLGRDLTSAVRVCRQHDAETRSYKWRLLVTAGLESAAEQLLQYSLRQGQTVAELYESQEYSQLLEVAAVNRDRVAYAAAKALGLRLLHAVHEETLTSSPVHSLKPLSSCLHNSIVYVDMGSEAGGPTYTLHLDTYPLHLYQEIAFMRSDKQLVLLLSPQPGLGSNWRNQFANTFPQGCGLQDTTALRQRVTPAWRSERAHGDKDCQKCWQGALSYNLAAIDEANQSWQDIEPDLHQLGYGPNWATSRLEVVLLKTAGPDEDKITAQELLASYDPATHKVRVPIQSKLFAGGDGYTGFWRVYDSAQDPPASALVQDNEVPGYISIPREMLLRIARANHEVSDEYRFEDEDSATVATTGSQASNIGFGAGEITNSDSVSVTASRYNSVPLSSDLLATGLNTEYMVTACKVKQSGVPDIAQSTAVGNSYSTLGLNSGNSSDSTDDSEGSTYLSQSEIEALVNQLDAPEYVDTYL